MTSSTINRETQPLRQALTLAHKRQHIKRVPYIRTLQEGAVRQGFFTYEEVVTLIASLPEYLKDFVWFAYYSGWHKGEIARLEWVDVDLPARSIRLRPEISKNAEGRLLALEGPLWKLIERRLDAGKGRWVFHRDGKPIGDFRKAWRTACTQAGLRRISMTSDVPPSEIWYERACRSASPWR